MLNPESFSSFSVYKPIKYWFLDGQFHMSDYENTTVSNATLEDDSAILRQIIARDYQPQNDIVLIQILLDTGANCAYSNASCDEEIPCILDTGASCSFINESCDDLA